MQDERRYLSAGIRNVNAWTVKKLRGERDVGVLS